MGIMTILSVIGAIVTIILAPLIFTFKGQPTVWDQLGNELGKVRNIPVGNESIAIPKNETFDFNNWVSEIPVHDLIKAINDGVPALVSWLARGLSALLTWVISKAIPGFIIPAWFGVILVIFVFVMVISRAVAGVADFSYNSFMWLTIAGIIGIIIAFTFLLLHII